MSRMERIGCGLGLIGLFLTVGAAAEPANPYQSVMVVPPASVGSALVAGFIDIQKNLLVTDRLVVRMNYDAEGLNFFFKIPKRGDYTLRAVAAGHDGEIWNDDAVELFIQVPGVREYYQYIVNSKGQVYDAVTTGICMNQSSWTGNLKAEVKVEKTFWQLTVKVPFSDIGFDWKKHKPILRGNIGIDSLDPKRKVTLGCCYTGGSFHKPEAFAEWQLSDRLPYLDKMEYGYEGGPSGKGYKVEYRLKNPSDTAVGTIGPKAAATFTKHFDLPKQLNILQVSQGDIFKYGFRVRNWDIPSLDVYAVDSKKMTIRMKDMERWQNVPLTAKVMIDGKEIAGLPWTQLLGKRFDYTGLSPAEHEVLVVLTDDQGRVNARAAKKIKLIDNTPIPYTLADLDASKYFPPVAIKSNEVRAARSVFELAQGGLARQIKVNDTAVLAEPIKLIFNSRELVCDPEVKVVEQNKNLVKILSTGRCGGNHVRVTSSFYYDGLVWNDVEVTGNGLTYGPLQVVLPIKSSPLLTVNHSYLATDNLFTKVSTKNSKAITDTPDTYSAEYLPNAFTLEKDMDLPLTSYVAIGSCAAEPYGLGFVTEGPQGWNLKNYDHVYQIRRRGAGQVDLIANISDGATAWKKDKIAFSFGYQPIPVRKYQPDHNSKVHINHCTVPGMYPATLKNEAGKTVTYAQYYREKGITTATFHEDWTEVEGYWRTWTPQRAEEIKKCSKALRDAGMKLELYFGFLASDVLPEFGFYRYLVAGTDTPNYSEGGFNRNLFYKDPEGFDDVRAWGVCKESVWGEYFLKGVAEAIREFDLGGVYTDGTPVCGPCTNTLHGCGYMDPYGRKLYTWPIFNQRRFNEILFMTGQKHSKDFDLDVHTGLTCMPMESLMSFNWTGEAAHLYDPLSRTLPGSMPGRFYGPLYGMPIETLMRPPYNIELIWAQSWLVDSFNRLNMGGGEEWTNASFKAWKIYDQYGLNGDCFVPFFNVKNQAKTDNNKIFVSYYDAKDYLAVVVSNYFTTEPQNVVLDLSKFKNVNLTTGQDVWNGGEVKGAEEKFSLTLPAGRMKLLVFKRS